MFTKLMDFPNLTIMRQFIEVAEQKVLARAAKRLNVSQPTLSKNMRRLENSFGATLLHRHSKGVVLTRAGEFLYQRAINIVLEYEKAKHEINFHAGAEHGVLRIGAGSVFSTMIIPAAIPQFNVRYPNYRIKIETMQVRSLSDALLRNQVSLAMGALISPDENSELRYLPVRRASHALVCSESHPLAHAPSETALNHLSDFPLISFDPDQELVNILANYCHQNKVPSPRYLVETNSIHGALQLLRAGNYILFSSSLFAEYTDRKDLVNIALPSPISEYEMGFIYRPDIETIPAYRGFMNIVRNILK